MKKCKPSTTFSQFYLAKGNLPGLDRLGKSSGGRFHVLSSEEVMRYLTFDIQPNNLVVLGPLILRPGLIGVPIGGFLGTQLTELWCMWREGENLFRSKASSLPCRSKAVGGVGGSLLRRGTPGVVTISWSWVQVRILICLLEEGKLRS